MNEFKKTKCESIIARQISGRFLCSSWKQRSKTRKKMNATCDVIYRKHFFPSHLRQVGLENLLAQWTKCTYPLVISILLSHCNFFHKHFFLSFSACVMSTSPISFKCDRHEM